jgi:hypothetical protein
MRRALWLLGLVVGCSGSTTEPCPEVECECDGVTVPGTCDNAGQVICECPAPEGTGGADSSGGTAATGGSSSGGSASGGEPANSGGARSSGGSVGAGGISLSGGAPGSGGVASSGGQSSGGAATGGAPAQCDDEACSGLGRVYYCGGDPEAPTCLPCTPGWCNCDESPVYEEGNGTGEACETEQYPSGTSCLSICT